MPEAKRRVQVFIGTAAGEALDRVLSRTGETQTGLIERLILEASGEPRARYGVVVQAPSWDRMKAENPGLSDAELEAARIPMTDPLVGLGLSDAERKAESRAARKPFQSFPKPPRKK